MSAWVVAAGALGSQRQEYVSLSLRHAQASWEPRWQQRRSGGHSGRSRRLGDRSRCHGSRGSSASRRGSRRSRRRGSLGGSSGVVGVVAAGVGVLVTGAGIVGAEVAAPVVVGAWVVAAAA